LGVSLVGVNAKNPHSGNFELLRHGWEGWLRWNQAGLAGSPELNARLESCEPLD